MRHINNYGKKVNNILPMSSNRKYMPGKRTNKKTEKQTEPEPVVEQDPPIAEKAAEEEVVTQADVKEEEEQKEKSRPNNTGIILPDQFKASRLTTSVPRKRKMKNGQEKLNAMLLHNNMPIYLETPRCKAPFGVSSFNPKPDDPNTKVEWSLNISASPLSESDDKEKKVLENFFEEWLKVEEFMIEHGIQYSKVIFGKEIKSQDVMKEKFYDIVKGKDTRDEYPLRIQPKIQKARDKDGQIIEKKPNVTVYETGSTEPMKIDTFDQLAKIVSKGSIVKCILQPRMYYIGGKQGKYGISLNVLQILVRKRSGARPGSYAFSDVPDKDETQASDSGSDEHGSGEGTEEVVEEVVEEVAADSEEE